MSPEIRTGLIEDVEVDGSPSAPNYRPEERKEKKPELPALVVQEYVFERRIQSLKFFLSTLGFNQGTTLRRILSWLFFLGFGVALPSAAVHTTRYGACNGGFQFQDSIIFFYFLLGAVPFHYISSMLQMHDIHGFLFVKHYQGEDQRFLNEYVKLIKRFFSVLICWILPCLIAKIICAIAWMIYNHKGPWWANIAILFCLTSPWVYLATIYLSACLVFNLVCKSMVIRFEEYGRLLESNSNHVFNFLDEHMHLRHQLFTISHRFRMFLLVTLFSVTISQFLTLLQTTSYGRTIQFVDAVDFFVASTIQVVGVCLCLHAAAKISHRAKGVASVASRWHALETCSRDVEDQKDLGFSARTSTVNESKISLESVNCMRLPNTRVAADVSSYQKREALVLYLQTNSGGITLFGFTVDRALINTIFLFEVSLVTFVLGKTLSLAQGKAFWSLA